MARPTVGSSLGDCLLLGLDPLDKDSARVVGVQIVFVFAHQRALEVGGSSLSAGVCGAAWSAWTFGEGFTAN